MKKILVAYDGSEGAKKALNRAMELSKSYNASLTALWVGGYMPYYHESVAEVQEEENAIEKFANKLKKELKNASLNTEKTIEFKHIQGNPAKQIVEYATNNMIDLIVVGCEGHSGLWKNNLGHVAEKVSNYATCDVLITRL